MPSEGRKTNVSGAPSAGDGLLGRASVVVIDDRATNRSILKKLAHELAEHVEVSAYGDVDEALAAVVSEPPDLLITDYKMPKLNGAEFVRQLREAPKCFDVPVIVVTAYEDKQFRYDALRAGASDFLLTPVDRLEFVQRGRNLLIMHRQHQELTRQAKARERRLQMANRLRERELRFSEEKFRLVINTVPALINATDADGHLAFVNTHHAELFGLDPSEAVGAAMTSMFPEDYADRHAKANRRVLESGESLTFEEMVEGRGGGRTAMLTSKAPLVDAEGQIANVVTVSVDISERKRAERELADAKDTAQRANRAKTEFLANISHELRTPLNAVLGFADVARRELLGPIGSTQYRDYQEDIYASASQLLNLIEDLLDVSKLELGRIEPKPERVDIPATIEHEVRSHREEAKHHDITVTSAIADDVGELVTDPVRFRQILTNLMSNAIKYTTAGGAVTVEASVRPDGGGVRCVVADSGPGMNADEIEIALSRFGRLGRAITHDRPGAGLGLPIAADLARLLGGTLDIDSAPGNGTRVIVDLPNMTLSADGDVETGAGDDAQTADRVVGGQSS